MSDGRRRVFECIAAQSWRGVTDREIAESLGMSPSSVRRHRSALARDSLIVKAGFTRKDGPRGYACDVWEAQ